MAVVAAVSFTFIVVGEINTLAPIVTMPFLLTYACIDYAYFALAQTFDLQQQREERFYASSNLTILAENGDEDVQYLVNNGAMDDDLDSLFPERVRHKNIGVTSRKKISTIKKNLFHFFFLQNSETNTKKSTRISNERTKLQENSPMAPHIHSKTTNWYSNFCNRYLSLFGVSVFFLDSYYFPA